MKFVVNVFLALFLTISGAFAIGGFQTTRAEAYSLDDALMTIRFNHNTVTYQDKLFYVVSEAVKTKPSVIFDVVAITPDGQSTYGQRVAGDIARIGVNQQQITFRAEAGRVNSEEVRIFVR